ncbi:hypothetical protein C0585_01075 [Candidatus Woesearchaeota archaeon]|nr:MAG: hypothetical protein C0585_01075 [Candidatus Woesearchaeota archaeon]
MNNKKKYYYLLIFLILISGTIILSSIVYNNYLVVDVQKIHATFSIMPEKIIGLDKNTDYFNFGEGPIGSIAKRSFNLTNNYDFPIKVVINSKGNLTDLIILQNNNIILQPGEIRTIFIEAHAYENSSYGRYESELKFTFIRRLIY